MTDYVLCVSGSRDFDDYKYLSDSLDLILADHGRPRVIMHGAAPGADALASHYAYENKIDVDPYGAKWGSYGSGAGPIRNQLMALLLYPGDMLAAFPLPGSRGTRDMVSKVNKLDRCNIRVFEKGDN